MEKTIINTVIDLPYEVWKTIEEYPRHQISNFGRVKTYDEQKDHYLYRLTMVRLKDGYPIVTLGKNGSRYHVKIHRLVAKAFIPNPDNLPEVNHKDGNKTNNNISNLEWMTQLDNIKHAKENNLYKSHILSFPVKQLDLNGNLIKTFTSKRSASRETGVNMGSLNNVLKGIQKTSKGYRWEYGEIDNSEQNLNPDEIWKPLNLNNKYQISNYGQIRIEQTHPTTHKQFWYYRKPCMKTKGGKLRDLAFSIPINNEIKEYLVKRLVAEHFIDNLDPSLQIWHKDGDKLNNHINNLILFTQEEANEYMKKTYYNNIQKF